MGGSIASAPLFVSNTGAYCRRLSGGSYIKTGKNFEGYFSKHFSSLLYKIKAATAQANMKRLRI
jgi:hypothetical protein